MSIADQLARALHQRDEQPNIALAERLAKRKQPKAIAELSDLLSAGCASQQGDAIKVLYELAARKPQFLTPHFEALINALSSKNNRVVWGALTALSHLVETHPEQTFMHLDAVLKAAEKSSVIGKDRTVLILCQLCARGYAGVSQSLLTRVRNAAKNQFPTYAEQAAEVLNDNDKAALRQILVRRLPKMEHPAKIKRVERLLKRLAHTSDLST